MTSTDFNPSKFAADMQLRTRREKNFEDFEAKLPDPTAVGVRKQVSQYSVSSILGRLAKLNPFARAVDSGDVVWLFDNTAFRPSRLGSWQAEFVAAVFEREAKCKVVDIVTGVLRVLDLADDATERKTVEQRLMPFMWDIRIARTATVLQRGKQLKLGQTGINGISSDVLSIPSSGKGTLVPATVKTTSSMEGILDMQTYYAGPDGWGIISDIDDTIKVTMTNDPAGILRETFVNTPRPIPGMPELYASIKSALPQDTSWFYLSASPYNLYPFLKDFRNKFYPPGTIILKDSSWKTVSGLLSALTLGTEEYKVDRIKKIQSWLPKKKMIMIGDSTQSDPEAYGEIYRTFPGWVALILIRKATDVAEFGIQEKNQPERFEKAFHDIPKEAWHVFEDPSECLDLIRTAISRR